MSNNFRGFAASPSSDQVVATFLPRINMFTLGRVGQYLGGLGSLSAIAFASASSLASASLLFPDSSIPLEPEAPPEGEVSSSGTGGKYCLARRPILAASGRYKTGY